MRYVRFLLSNKCLSISVLLMLSPVIHRLKETFSDCITTLNLYSRRIRTTSGSESSFDISRFKSALNLTLNDQRYKSRNRFVAPASSTKSFTVLSPYSHPDDSTSSERLTSTDPTTVFCRFRSHSLLTRSINANPRHSLSHSIT